MAVADSDRDERIAELLDEIHRPGSTIRDADTLWHTHPDVAEEVMRLAKTESDLREAVSDWNLVTGDETVSRFAAAASDTEGESGEAKSGAALEQVGRYRIVQLLGEGGMGAVYAADDPQLHRRVAVKVPHFTGPTEKQEHARRRFLREAQSAAAVEHANVCPIHDVGEHDGRPFVVMALVEGESLTQRLRRLPRLEVREATALIVKIAGGLAAVHAHGIVHRDLKPGNVLMRQKDGEPVLTDFGLAQVSHGDDNLTADGMILGTPAYMSPEQADPTLGPVTVRSDLYSLGVILFEMVTDRRPYEGAMMQIIAQLSAGNMPSASQFRSDLDPDLDAIITRALARNPADRFADADAFATELTHWLDGDSTASLVCKPKIVVATANTFNGRRRNTWLSVGAAAIVVFSALGFYLMRDDRRPEAAPVHQPPIAVAPAKRGPKVKPALVAAAPIRGFIDVKVWRKNDFDPVAKSLKHEGYPLHDPLALPLAPEDWLRIEVELNRPAYCYVVWIDTEGRVTPLYPWLNDDWKQRPEGEKAVDRLKLPDLGDSLAIAPLGPGPAGVETILLLTRDEVLPAETDLSGLFAGLAAQTGGDRQSAAWFENGRLVTKENELDRGAIRLSAAQAIEHPAVQTQAILRGKLGDLFGYTRAVSFSNRGDR